MITILSTRAVLFLACWLLVVILGVVLWHVGRRLAERSNRPHMPRLRGRCEECLRPLYVGQPYYWIEKQLWCSTACYGDFCLASRLAQIHDRETHGRVDAA